MRTGRGVFGAAGDTQGSRERRNRADAALIENDPLIE